MGKSVERRKLRFSSLDEAIAETGRLLDAHTKGNLRRAGNWDLGQTFNHLATWAEFPFAGYPPEVKAPLPVRMFLRTFRSYILNQGMITGVKIGKLPGGTLGMEKIDASVGADRLQTVFTTLKGQCPPARNPVFGSLSHEEWIKLNLRHTELHFSFQIPQR